MSSASMDQSWAFGPQQGASAPLGWRPFGLAAGVVVAIGVAGLIGFVAFVNIVGQEDAAPPIPAQMEAGADEVAPAAPVSPVDITDIRLTDSIDASTGEPGTSADVFTVGDPVTLWLSFDAGDDAVPLTAVWYRGDNRVARLTAPLPDTSSQMVFPLPQLAADRPGPYRVEVRSAGEVLAAESFEVTHG